MTYLHAIPACFGGGMVCADDCVVSCAYWEECESEAERREQEEFCTNCRNRVWCWDPSACPGKEPMTEQDYAKERAEREYYDRLHGRSPP